MSEAKSREQCAAQAEQIHDGLLSIVNEPLRAFFATLIAKFFDACGGKTSPTWVTFEDRTAGRSFDTRTIRMRFEHDLRSVVLSIAGHLERHVDFEIPDDTNDALEPILAMTLHRDPATSEERAYLDPLPEVAALRRALEALPPDVDPSIATNLSKLAEDVIRFVPQLGPAAQLSELEILPKTLEQLKTPRPITPDNWNG